MGAAAVTAAGLARRMWFLRRMRVSHFGIVAVGVSVGVLVGEGSCRRGVGVVGCAPCLGAFFIIVSFRRGDEKLSLLLLDESPKTWAFASFQVGSRGVHIAFSSARISRGVSAVLFLFLRKSEASFAVP